MEMAAQSQISSKAKEVANLLLDISSVQLNVSSPFTWVSKIQSPIYCDNRKIVSDIEARRKIRDIFCEHINSQFENIDIIAGVATGGIPLGMLVADKLNLPFIYVREARKEHGLKKQVEGDYKSGDRIVLIEDHISTGGSSIRAINGIKEEGLVLLGLVSIMTYGFTTAIENFEKDDIEFSSLCDLDTIVEVAQSRTLISEADADSIFRFRDNPGQWAKA